MAERTFVVWLVAILKGGCRKSTTAMMTAFALMRKFELENSDDEVLVIDADAGTQGVTDWASIVYAEGGQLPFHVVQWSPRLGLLVPFVLEAQQRTGARFVIIDVGGEAPEVVTQAARLADQVITPVGAEKPEIRRMGATSAILKPSGVPMKVLLNKVPTAGVGTAASVRQVLVADGYQVMATEIPRNLELYSHCWGTVPEDLGKYVDLADELLKESV